MTEQSIIDIKNDLIFIKLDLPTYFKDTTSKTIPLSMLIKQTFPPKTFYNNDHLYSYCSLPELEQFEEQLLKLPGNVGEDCTLYRIEPDAKNLPQEVSSWFNSVPRTLRDAFKPE
ncbi:hypothetical protein [Pseudoalteromonas sp. EB27]|uniref:hypothetical protein n=1 Tax=Pseudoalteromonas sp. EB27 TaxID=1938368 RepID=UPI00097770F0|nr:hypothetical protein [Pseudoalteromonas sp. EB27]